MNAFARICYGSAVVCLALSGLLLSRSANLRSDLDRLTADCERLRSQLASSTHRVRTEGKREKGAAVVAHGHSKNTADSKNQTVRPRSETVGVSLKKAPKGKDAAAMAAQTRPQIRTRFAAMYRKLKSTPEQIDQFERAIGENIVLLRSLDGASFGLNSPEVESGIREGYLRQLAPLAKGAFGEEGMAAFAETVNLSAVQSVVNDLNRSAAFSGASLTPAQVDRLTEILTRSAGMDPAAGFIAPESLNWDYVLIHAEGTLTAAQVAHLRALSKMRRFDEEYRRITGFRTRPPARGL